MAIGNAWRGNSPVYYEFISPEELLAHFSDIQAKGLTGHSGNLQPELISAVGTNSQ